jgi:LysM repeat protein
MASMKGLPDRDNKDMDALKQAAERIDPLPEFQVRLESKLKQAHRPRAAANLLLRDGMQLVGLAVAVALMAVLLSWVFRSLAPLRVPAAGTTATPASLVGTPTASQDSQPRPTGDGYEWRGTTLYLQAGLPAGPAEASVFTPKPETPATLEYAQQLASRFDIAGQVYESPGDLPGTTAFSITDGKQWLRVRSDYYFDYYPDYTAWQFDTASLDVPDAEAQIGEFMQAYGFDFPYRVRPSEFFTGYYALPLTQDGLALQHEHFQSSGMLFKFGRNGIGMVQTSLLNFEQAGVYRIRSAQEAFERLLDPNAMAGIQEGMHGSTAAFPAWYRTYPQDTPVRLYGWLEVLQPVTAPEPLVLLSGRRVKGSLSDMAGFREPRYVMADGQLHLENGVEVFELQSWALFSNGEEGLQGTLEQRGDQVVLTTVDGETLLMPDVPSDIALPLENVYALGVREGDVFSWNSFDLRMVSGGGGGGGGGLGLYQLNLSGTPVPFPVPTSTPLPAIPTAGSGTQYTIQAGDTLGSIAARYGITAEALQEYNGLIDPSTIYIGQILMIPVPAQPQADGWQGLLTITIIKGKDGSQRTQYGFSLDGGAGFYILDGQLEALNSYHNRPVRIWGPVQGQDANGQPLIKVDKYEIPYPDLGFRLLKGAQSNQPGEGGQTLTLFTAEDGQTYVELYPDGMVNENPLEPQPDNVVVEALLIPGETHAGYPAMRVFGIAMATSPKTGQPSDIKITADQPYVVDQALPGDMPPIPTATIEKVELVYFIPNPRYQIPDPSQVPGYIQPMWRFSGHYSHGDEFEIMVQALADEFLSPELVPIEGPG